VFVLCYVSFDFCFVRVVYLCIRADFVIGH